jgi:two-component system sensor histidine kinase MprB
VSLRRRITAAAALAVAVIAAAVGAIAYTSTRSHLRGEIDQQLTQRASGFLGPHPDGGEHHGGPPPGQGFLGPPHGAAPRLPSSPPFGGASGYFQFVYPDGYVRAGDGGTPELPVDAHVRQVAGTGRGRYYADTTALGMHLRVLVAYDPFDHYAVQVALPLTQVDHVLHGLALTYALLVAGGVLVAVVVGGLLGRAALAPIERFTRRTERVSGALDSAERLEETGAAELVRLAASFNRTLAALERSVEAQRQLVADASRHCAATSRSSSRPSACPSRTSVSCATRSSPSSTTSRSSSPTCWSSRAGSHHASRPSRSRSSTSCARRLSAPNGGRRSCASRSTSSPRS